MRSIFLTVLAVSTALVCAVRKPAAPLPRHRCTRRAVANAAALSVLTRGTRAFADETFTAAPAVGAPLDWTAFWRGSATTAPKQTNLPISAVADILRKDLGDNKYILTGQLTPSIFADDCEFTDPNNSVRGLSKYQQALSLLFDPSESSLELKDLRVADGHIEADYTASGVLKLPWRPKISGWAGHVVYSLNADGLIASQVDVWNITRVDAIRQTFTPPPASAAECDDACQARIAERRAIYMQSRTTTSRQEMFDLSRQRAALYNTTYRGASCVPGLPCS